LKALLDRVELLPDVRADAVAEVARRLSAGELSTGDALARTAEALQSAPGTIVPSGAKAPPSDAKSDIPGEIEAALGRIPHARQDVVAEASRRLREGELSNLDAIRRTASAIL